MNMRNKPYTMEVEVPKNNNKLSSWKLMKNHITRMKVQCVEDHQCKIVKAELVSLNRLNKTKIMLNNKYRIILIEVVNNKT